MGGLATYRNKVAVVTGASSGIGAELGRQLARRGTRVALVARRKERLEELVKEIEEAGGQASAHTCNVCARSEVEAVYQSVIAQWKRVDLLVNNAGIGRHVLFEDQEVDEIEHIMRTNYLGAVYWIKSVLPMLREQRSGWILNMSSMAGLIPQPDEAAYSASKFALSALSEALGHEVARHGVHVMAVHPALVRTEMISEDVLRRLPKAARGSLIEADVFVAESLRALERGETSVVIPRRFGAVVRLYAASPRLFGGAIGKIKMRAVPESNG
jgi:short-subunit dehydrogenase